MYAWKTLERAITRLESEPDTRGSWYPTPQTRTLRYPYVALMLTDLPARRKAASVARLTSGQRKARHRRGTPARRVPVERGLPVLMRLGAFVLRRGRALLVER